MDGWMDGWTDGWMMMDGRMDGRMDRRIDDDGWIMMDRHYVDICVFNACCMFSTHGYLQTSLQLAWAPRWFIVQLAAEWYN